MEKLVISYQGAMQKELALEKKELSIGRDPASDVHLHDPLVSRHHAKLFRIFSEYYLEDLDSTNGTCLNERRVRKHILRNGDLIQIGSHELRFVASEREEKNGGDLEQTMVIAAVPTRPSRPPEVRSSLPSGWVRYLRGPDEGESQPLNKSLFTLGRSGERMAVIARRPRGFFLLHLGGDGFPSVNDKPVQRGGVQLQHGDIVDVGDVRVQILFDDER